MPVAKYRSRRKRLTTRHKGGAEKPKPKEKKGGAVPTKILDVHPSAHHPEDLVKVMQSVPEATSIARKMLQEHHEVARAVKAPIRFPQYRARVADHSVDLHAMAKAIFKKHKFKHMPKLGGGLSAKQVIGVARQVGDPIKEANKAKNSYDQVNLHDWSAKGVGRNIAHGYSGNFHVAAGHMKATNIATAGAFGGMLLPAANAFSAVGDAFGSL